MSQLDGTQFFNILKTFTDNLLEISSFLEKQHRTILERINSFKIHNENSSTVDEDFLIEFEDFVDTTFRQFKVKRREFKNFVVQCRSKHLENCENLEEDFNKIKMNRALNMPNDEIELVRKNSNSSISEERLKNKLCTSASPSINSESFNHDLIIDESAVSVSPISEHGHECTSEDVNNLKVLNEDVVDANCNIKKLKNSSNIQGKKASKKSKKKKKKASTNDAIEFVAKEGNDSVYETMNALSESTAHSQEENLIVVRIDEDHDIYSTCKERSPLHNLDLPITASLHLDIPSTSSCNFNDVGVDASICENNFSTDDLKALAKFGIVTNCYVELENFDFEKVVNRAISKNQKKDTNSRKLYEASVGIDDLLNNFDDGEEIEDNHNIDDDFASSFSEGEENSSKKSDNEKNEKTKNMSKNNSKSRSISAKKKKIINNGETVNNDFVGDTEEVNNVVDEDEEEEEEEEDIKPSRRLTRSCVKDETDALLKKKVLISSDESDEDEDEEEQDSDYYGMDYLNLKRKRNVSSSMSSISGIKVGLNESDVDNEDSESESKQKTSEDDEVETKPKMKGINSESDEDDEVEKKPRRKGLNSESMNERNKSKSKQSKSTSKKKKRRINNLTEETKTKRRRIAVDSEDERSLLGSDVETAEVLIADTEKTGSQKVFRGRKMMSHKNLTKSTLDAEKAEIERRKRLQEKQKEFNGIEILESTDSGKIVLQLSDQSVLAPRLKSLTLDNDSKSDPPQPVKVHQSLVNLLKPHQAEGIVFMYNSMFESIERMNGGDSYGGILAHCMGLGKTFQVIAFLHTVLTHPKLFHVVRRVMIVGPKNVTTNWAKEFSKWLANIDPELDVIKIYELSNYVQMYDRLNVIKLWFNSRKPAALIISYEMFRILTKSDDDESVKKSKNTKASRKKSRSERNLDRLRVHFREYLQDPGPDLVICDEGHKLKSDDTAIFRAMSKIHTRRRLCLTGTPMQNNLKEYYTMVSFVKPGLLGTKIEFANRFSNIISRGQDADATALEVRCMKRRCHVLYEFLRAVVQRRDYRVLVETIPPKQEYVIYVRMTERQCKLYRTFLEMFVDHTQLSKQILPDYYIFARIWTHPFSLILHERDAEKKRLFQDDQDFVVSGSEDNRSTNSPNNSIESDDEEPSTSTALAKQYSTRQNPIDSNVEEVDEPLGWYSKPDLVTIEDEHNFELGNKLVLLMQIIKKCEEIGDKILIFSQSLESLRIIRNMLTYLSTKNLWFVDGHEALRANGEEWSWVNGMDYLVIDGSVSNKTRDFIQDQFNDPLNLRARLMLISTLAGSLGTNLVTANRVIIFDACWNPSHDTQAMFRVYRYGQSKPVYIYRLIAQGTMEERIYKRQVTKESTAKRVTEEAQIQRHFRGSDLCELYEFTPIMMEDEGGDSQIIRLAPPKDRLLADVILSHGNAIVSYLQHDSLFDEIEDEKLTDAERKEAWEDFELEKNRSAGIVNPLNRLSSLPSHLMILPNDSPALLNFTRNFSNDLLYRTCFTIKHMTADIAIRVLFVKRLLDQLMPTIPHDRRGGIHEFDNYFVNIINDTYTKQKPPIDLLDRAIRVFQTTVAIVRDVQACGPSIQSIFSIAPHLFIPLV